MWPWEHLAFGYVLYSLGVRLGRRQSPRGEAVAVVAFASIFPDLVDKPLSWSFGVTTTGYSVAHSLFVVPAILALAAFVARRSDRPRLAGAFAVGYLSHLVGDVIYPAVRGGSLALHPVLWPVLEGTPAPGNLVDTVRRYLGRFIVELTAGDLSGVFLFELSLVAFTVLLWSADGFPVAAELYGALADSD